MVRTSSTLTKSPGHKSGVLVRIVARSVSVPVLLAIELSIKVNLPVTFLSGAPGNSLRQATRPGEILPHFVEIVLRNGELDVNRIDRLDVDELGGVRRDKIAGVDQIYSRLAVDRRRDRAVAEIYLGVCELTLRGRAPRPEPEVDWLRRFEGPRGRSSWSCRALAGAAMSPAHWRAAPSRNRDFPALPAVRPERARDRSRLSSRPS